MMIALAALVLATALDDVAVRARMGDGAIEPGGAHSFTVEFVVPEGTSATDSGLSSPFLQLDVPDGVTLTERPTNVQYVSVPFERLMEQPSVEIPFLVDASVADDATIGILITAYLSAGDARRFLRTRLELPVRGGAVAQVGDATDSSWGTDDTLLQIGDELSGFSLPVAEGVEPFDLGTVIGKRPVFLTTYRAHW